MKHSDESQTRSPEGYIQFSLVKAFAGLLHHCQRFRQHLQSFINCSHFSTGLSKKREIPRPKLYSRVQC